MEISPTIQAQLLLLCAALGAVTGVMADVFSEACQPLRRTARSVARFLSDLICVGSVFLGIIILSFYYDSGRIRLFDFLGAALGWMLYRAALSPLVRLILRRLIRIFLRFLRLLWFPCSYVCKKVKKNIEICKFYIVKSLEKNKYLLYNIYNIIIILKWAKFGFISKGRNK